MKNPFSWGPTLHQSRHDMKTVLVNHLRNWLSVLNLAISASYLARYHPVVFLDQGLLCLDQGLLQIHIVSENM